MPVEGGRRADGWEKKKGKVDTEIDSGRSVIQSRGKHKGIKWEVNADPMENRFDNQPES
jgi:hypothetical protein